MSHNGVYQRTDLELLYYWSNHMVPLLFGLSMIFYINTCSTSEIMRIIYICKLYNHPYILFGGTLFQGWAIIFKSNDSFTEWVAVGWLIN